MTETLAQFPDFGGLVLKQAHQGAVEGFCCDRELIDWLGQVPHPSNKFMANCCPAIALGYPVWYPSKISGAAVGLPRAKLEKLSSLWLI
jgi:hypothetical protein